MNYSFLIELYHVLIVPLSKDTRNEPMGSNTENCKDVTAFCYFEKASTLPPVIFTFPCASSLTDPKKMFPREVPTAKLIPFGLNTADVNTSLASNFN